jgi:hypothetical protein
VLRLAEVDRVDRLGFHARCSLPPHCSARRRYPIRVTGGLAATIASLPNLGSG